MSEENPTTMSDTSQYGLRHAANDLSKWAYARKGTWSAEDEEVIQYAYEQLHKGANLIAELEKGTS